MSNYPIPDSTPDPSQWPLSADFPGLPATGRSFSIPGVTVVIRHEEKIVRESIYYNLDDVRLQLGTSA